jgi:hypothetical protein
MRRPANSLEIYTGVMSRYVPIQFGFCLTLDAELGEAALRGALDETRRERPLIAVRTVRVDAGRYLVDSEGVGPFPVTTYPASAVPWAELLNAELRKPFDLAAGPGTRFALRPTAGGTELYCTFHHAFADGHAAVRCLDLLLGVLGGVRRARPVDRDLDLFAALRPDVAAELARRPPAPLPPPPRLDPAELRRRLAAPYRAPSFALRTWALSAAETARLVAASRDAGVTVHAALGAAWLTASAEVLGGQDRRTRTIQCPVDFRSYLREEVRDGSGVYFGIVTAAIDCAPGRALVDVARDIKRGIEAGRRDLKDLEWPHAHRDAFEGVADPDALVVSFPEEAPDYDFSLSNLGRLPLGTSYGSLGVRSVWGPTFTAVNGERVIGVNTHAGVLRMTDIWDPDRCDSAAYDEVRERARAKLGAFFAAG